jgi:hypothetical protein
VIIWSFWSSYVFINRFFINWTDLIFKASQNDCAIDSSTNVYLIALIFIIVIVRILFFNTQFIKTDISSNKSFFIKNDEMIKFFVFVTSLTKIIFFRFFCIISHVHLSDFEFFEFRTIANEMIWFVAIKTFICFYKLFFNRIEIKRFRNYLKRRNAKLIKISDRRFSKNLFDFFIDRDRDRNDVYNTINFNFRFDFDRSDCIQSFTRFDVINTFIIILFQLNQTN